MELPSPCSVFSSSLTETRGDNLFTGDESVDASNQEQVNCQFCPTIVLLNLGVSTSSTESSIKRSKMLKNICLRLGIRCDDIPYECPRSIYPLCNGCEDLMSQLWKLQERVDKIKAEISKIVDTIEQGVIDGHIMNLEVEPQLNKGVLCLKEKILEGYRKKLLVKRQLERNLAALNNSACGASSWISQDTRHEGFIATHSTGSSPATSRHVGSKDTEELNGMTDGANEDVETRINFEGSRSFPSTSIQNQQENIEFDISGKEPDDNIGLVEEDNAEDIEHHRKLAINNVGGGRQVIAEIISLVEVDLGINAPVDDAFDEKADDLCAGMPDKRRNILSFHKNKMGSRKVARKPLFRCGCCLETFSSKKALVEHWKTHTFECNICKRPFSLPNVVRNLRSHIFSHKNDAERKVALEAKEPGVRAAKLSMKTMGKKPKKGTKKSAPASSAENNGSQPNGGS